MTETPTPTPTKYKLNLPLLIVAGMLALGGIAWGVYQFSSGGKVPSRLTVLVSGRTEGFLENCGCSGGQAGGMHRRATMIKATRLDASKPIRSDAGKSSETLTIDIGDFSDPSDPRQKIRSKGIVKAMEMIGYDSVGLGQNELGFTQEELFNLLSEGHLLYLGANIKFIRPDDGEDFSGQLADIVKPYKVIPLKGGYKVGIIHVLDNSGIIRGEPIKTGYEVGDPVEAIDQILAQHGNETPFWILSVGTNEQYGLRNERLKDFDQIKLVFGMRGYQPEDNANGVNYPYFIDKPLDKGKDETVATVTFAEKQQLRITAVKVGIREDNYKPDPDVKKYIDDLKPELDEYEQKEGEEAMQATHVKGPLYLGSQSCATCHLDIAQQLEQTKHMHAYETLVKINRQHSSCAECHNLGFNEQPQSFNVARDKTFTGDWVMRNVQCESCHGPGEYHVKFLQNQAKIPELSTEGRDKWGLIPFKKGYTCEKCHDQENSPRFKFDEYWPHIQHGKDLTPKPGSPAGAGMTVPSHEVPPAEGDNHSSAGSHERRSRMFAQLHELL